MSRQEKQIAALALAVVGVAVLNKVAAKEARALGVPAVVIAALGWAVSKAV